MLDVCRAGSEEGHTLLHLAVLGRSLPMLRMLLRTWPRELGLPVHELNRPDQRGRTPLDYLTGRMAGAGGGGALGDAGDGGGGAISAGMRAGDLASFINAGEDGSGRAHGGGGGAVTDDSLGESIVSDFAAMAGPLLRSISGNPGDDASAASGSLQLRPPRFFGIGGGRGGAGSAAAGSRGGIGGLGQDAGSSTAVLAGGVPRPMLVPGVGAGSGGRGGGGGGVAGGGDGDGSGRSDDSGIGARVRRWVAMREIVPLLQPQVPRSVSLSPDDRSSDPSAGREDRAALDAAAAAAAAGVVAAATAAAAVASGTAGSSGSGNTAGHAASVAPVSVGDALLDGVLESDSDPDAATSNVSIAAAISPAAPVVNLTCSAPDVSTAPSTSGVSSTVAALLSTSTNTYGASAGASGGPASPAVLAPWEVVTARSRAAIPQALTGSTASSASPTSAASGSRRLSLDSLLLRGRSADGGRSDGPRDGGNGGGASEHNTRITSCSHNRHSSSSGSAGGGLTGYLLGCRPIERPLWAVLLVLLSSIQVRLRRALESCERACVYAFKCVLCVCVRVCVCVCVCVSAAVHAVGMGHTGHRMRPTAMAPAHAHGNRSSRSAFGRH